MLYTPSNDFGWQLDNWGATYNPSSVGTSVSAHATNANQKGTAVSIFSGASVTTDVFGISLWFFTVSTAATRVMFDVLVDPAGGSSWSVLIANLAVNTPNYAMGGVKYYFPIYIKAGTSIGLQQQCSTAAVTCRAGVLVIGKPSHPELAQVGSVVETIGASTGTTVGTTMTPGNAAMGSYTAALGTLTRSCWFWQCGLLINNATQTAVPFGANLEFGDASNKLIAGRSWEHIEPGTTETASKQAFPTSGMPFRRAPAGTSIYARAWAGSAPDSGISAIAYCVS